MITCVACFSDVDAAVAAALAKLDATLDSLTAAAASAPVPNAVKFAKDERLHVDFIYACTNVCASNYEILPASKAVCHAFAGNITPASASTAAAIAGLVCLEVFKRVKGKPLPSFRECNLNVGTNVFQLFEPAGVKVCFQLQISIG